MDSTWSQHVPEVGRLPPCLLVSAGDIVTGQGPTGTMSLGRLEPVTEAGLEVPKAVDGRRLAQGRDPGVNAVTAEGNGVSGPEVGARPVLMTVLRLRLWSVRRVTGAGL